MPQKPKVLGQFLQGLLLSPFFVLRDWAVILSVKHEKWGQMSSVPLMGRATKELGRSPAGSNTETSVSHRTKRTRTFGGHMVFEISSQFQTI